MGRGGHVSSALSVRASAAVACHQGTYQYVLLPIHEHEEILAASLGCWESHGRTDFQCVSLATSLGGRETKHQLSGL